MKCRFLSYVWPDIWQRGKYGFDGVGISIRQGWWWWFQSAERVCGVWTVSTNVAGVSTTAAAFGKTEHATTGCVKRILWARNVFRVSWSQSTLSLSFMHTTNTQTTEENRARMHIRTRWWARYKFSVHVCVWFSCVVCVWVMHLLLLFVHFWRKSL